MWPIINRIFDHFKAVERVDCFSVEEDYRVLDKVVQIFVYSSKSYNIEVRLSPRTTEPIIVFRLLSTPKEWHLFISGKSIQIRLLNDTYGIRPTDRDKALLIDYAFTMSWLQRELESRGRDSRRFLCFLIFEFT